MRKFVAVGGLVVLGMFALKVASPRAVADDDDDRKAEQRAELVKNIDEKVGQIGDELSGFESDTDVGDLDDALSKAREVNDLVGKLRDVAGDDSRAQDIVSHYPGYVDQFRDAAMNLKRMKEVQRTADGVADKCAADESTLQSTIRGYVGNPDEAEEAFTKLPEMGKAYGRTWGEMLEKLRERDGDLQRGASSARFSVSADNWSRVTSSFGTASAGIQSYWKERFQAAETACKRLALGEKHPDIEKALDDLGKYKGTAKATVTQLVKDYDEWLREVRKLRKFSDDDRDAIREVLCTAGEYEMDAKANEVADRWASQISSVYGTALGQADRLKNRALAKELAKYKGPKKVLEGIGKNLTSLAKLKNYELAGSNDPKLRAKLEWGKKRHEDLEGACNVSELAISSSDCDNTVRPGSGCRADCLKDCSIVEFKPDSSGAKAEAEKQLASYKGGLEKWYKRDRAELFKKYPDVESCENNDKTALELKTETITYELCSSTVRNELGEVLDEATLDLPENENGE